MVACSLESVQTDHRSAESNEAVGEIVRHVLVVWDIWLFVATEEENIGDSREHQEIDKVDQEHHGRVFDTVDQLGHAISQGLAVDDDEGDLEVGVKSHFPNVPHEA